MSRGDNTSVPNYLNSIPQETLNVLDKLPNKNIGIIIPPEILIDHRLSSTEKIIFAIIYCSDLTNRGSFWGNKSMETILNVSQQVVSKTYSKLSDLGLITIEYEVNHGRTKRTARCNYEMGMRGKVKESYSVSESDTQGIRNLITNNDINNNNVSKETYNDSSNHDNFRKSSLVEYWNTLPNIRQHTKPQSNVYRTAHHRLKKLLQQGSFIDKFPLDESWCKKEHITERHLTRTWTLELIKQALTNVSTMFTPGFEPESKGWMPKDLPTIIYNDNTQKSLLLYASIVTPKPIFQKREMRSRRQAKELGVNELTEMLGETLLYANRKANLGPDEFKQLTSIVMKISEGAESVNDVVRDYCTYIKKRYEGWTDLGALTLRVGGKAWTTFLEERNKQR